MKTEKKTVQFSDEVQVETIEPEPEPVYIDEVSVIQLLIFQLVVCLNMRCLTLSNFTSKVISLKYQESVTKREMGRKS